jgi:hypothetical protein
MRIYIVSFLVAIFVLSCSEKNRQKEAIPLNTMKVVILQLMKADEHYMRVSALDSNWRIQHKNVQFYQQIFDLNKVDRVQFYQQIEYLEKHPIEFKELMDSVNELSKREKLPI